MPLGAQGGTDLTKAAETRLSRQRVAEAALALVDAEGPDALSMRRLASELGVGTMTLYHYFPSKRELLDAVVDAAFAEPVTPALEGSWREQATQLVHAARGVLSQHPGIARLRARQPILRADALRFGEAGLRILEDAGFETDEAAKAFRLLFTYTLGFAILSPKATERATHASARQALSSLPPEYFPRLSSAVDEAAEAMAGDVVFEYGLQRVLDGLEARLLETRNRA